MSRPESSSRIETLAPLVDALQRSCRLPISIEGVASDLPPNPVPVATVAVTLDERRNGDHEGLRAEHYRCPGGLAAYSIDLQDELDTPARLFVGPFGLAGLYDGDILLGYGESLGLDTTALHGELERIAVVDEEQAERSFVLARALVTSLETETGADKESGSSEAMHARVHNAEGIAQIASSVLHNVNNVLTAANTTGAVIASTLRQSKVPSLLRLAELLREHQEDFPEFVRNEEQGQKLPGYLAELATVIGQEHERLTEQTRRLQESHEHIRQIVQLQQNYGSPHGGVEAIRLDELVRDATQLFDSSFERHHIDFSIEAEPELPLLAAEKHKVLQIVINLLKNAGDAVKGEQGPRRVVARIEARDGGIALELSDNGTGIAPKDLPQVFDYGFTTKADGHGYGLHGSRAAASELGGRLEAASDGEGQGARFTLVLPLRPPNQEQTS